ncbi:MAG TPA: hypothetical protein DEQ32_15480 [Gammaproteobacteria bacterium]|nr:hypothetical protein [Gammaproteobacteria bacterium]
MRQDFELIDFTAEWFSQRAESHLKAGEYELASFMSALLEGYLDGLWLVDRFKDGEPILRLSEYGKTITTSGKFNDFKGLDELFSGGSVEASSKGPLGEE